MIRILVAQDVEYLRCKQMLTVGVAVVGGALWGLRPLSSVVSSLFNLQYGWNGFICRDMKILGANAEIAQLVVACDSYSQGRWFEPTSRY